MATNQNCSSEDCSSDFDASTQIKRILKILSDTIKHSELVLYLPCLIANECALLNDFFPSEAVSFIRDKCTTLLQKQEQQHTEPIEPELKADVYAIIDFLLSQPQLAGFCTSLPDNSISPAGMALLRSLEELRICVSEHLKITPKMEAQQDAQLRRLYQQNMRNKEELTKLTEKFDKLAIETKQETEEKKQLIKQQVDKIIKVKKQCKDNVKKKMDEAERQISWDVKNSEYVLEELNNKAKNTQYRRDIQLKEHLNTEKELRAKRYNVESELVATLQKYDTDIGERQALLEQLTATFEEEKHQMAVLQEQFDAQETEYEKLMMEKQQYEREQWEAKLYDIRCRVAARKIQRWWRAYLERKKGGKKGKKGKKKK